MYCDACGTALQPGQAFCGKCAKPVREGISLAYPRPSRVREHVRLLGILWLAYSALHIVAGASLVILANTIFPRISEYGVPRHGPPFLHTMFLGLGFLLFIKAAIGFAGGWGLLRRAPWGRIITLVVAFISLFNVPLGTALGIYTLWVLLPAQSDKDYDADARAA
jgi:hypothetical protein